MTRIVSRGRVPRAAVLLGTATLLIAALLPAPVAAAAPSNDDIASATEVDAFPFSDTVDTSEATPGATDPTFCFSEPGDPGDDATVWYSFTPDASGEVAVDTFGSDYDTTLYVGTPDGSGGIDVLACVDDTLDLQSGIIWEATAGTEYLIVVGTCCGSGEPGDVGPGGTLELHIGDAPPPTELDLAVTRASVSRYGVVTVTGTITCENAMFANLDIGIQQAFGRFVLTAFTFEELACDGTQPFEVELSSFDGRFRGGSAQLFAFAFACGPFNCVEDVEDRRIRIR